MKQNTVAEVDGNKWKNAVTRNHRLPKDYSENLTEVSLEMHITLIVAVCIAYKF
jgi:DNA-binding ferritin-like protein (Dps family)